MGSANLAGGTFQTKMMKGESLFSLHRFLLLKALHETVCNLKMVEMRKQNL